MGKLRILSVVIISLNPPAGNTTIVSGQVSNNNGQNIYVNITGQLATSGTVTVQAQTDASGYYIDSITAALIDSSILKA